MSMARRRFFQLIQIHPTLIIFMFIGILTGTFVQLFIIICIVTIHELGHFFAATYFRWRIESMVLWVFGGVLKTDEYTTRPLLEECIVTVAGPIQHGVIYLVAYLLNEAYFIPPSIVSHIFYFNTIILLFNLLPIYPLDGAKLWLILLSLRLPYRLAYRLTLFISFIMAAIVMIVSLLFFPFTLTTILLIVFLIMEVIKYWRNEYFTFIRFLLYRLHNEPYDYKQKNLYAKKDDYLIELFNQFRRNKYHRIYNTAHTFISEKRALHMYFHESRHAETIQEIMKRK